jgi:hypothetical protein
MNNKDHAMRNQAKEEPIAELNNIKSTTRELE